ncbi:MAG: hypothetical protein RMK18_10650, partial [Armatimonadota bacterium]|nr:hypothetical protein [Armatimonadota bacterium]
KVRYSEEEKEGILRAYRGRLSMRAIKCITLYSKVCWFVVGHGAKQSAVIECKVRSAKCKIRQQY